MKSLQGFKLRNLLTPGRQAFSDIHALHICCCMQTINVYDE